MSTLTPELLMWYNGEYTPYKPVIFPDEKGINYGLGNFEGIREEMAFFWPGEPCNNSAIYALKEHVDRLFFSAKMLYLEIPYSKEQITQSIKDVVTKNNLRECYIRPLVWDATRKIGIHGKPEKVGVAIMAKPFGKYIDKAGGLKLMISSIRRPHPNTTINEAKFTSNYLNSFLATIEAHNAGYDEALLLDVQGMVSELPGANIMIIEKDRIITPPKCCSILPGITRDTIMKMTKQAGWEAIEEEIPTGRLFRAETAFACGTAMKIAPIDSVNGHRIGEDNTESDSAREKVKSIIEGYQNIVTGQVQSWRNMLTFLYPEFSLH